MKVLLLHLEQFAYPTAKWNVRGVHWCKEIKNKLSHMLKCMCSQNWWLDHTTPSPSNVICDLLLCNKLPYHVILAGRSSHACKKQSNHSPLLYQNLSSNPMSSLHTMQPHIYCKLLAWNSGFLTMSSHYILSTWFCCLLKNVFLFLIVSCKALPKEG